MFSYKIGRNAVGIAKCSTYFAPDNVLKEKNIHRTIGNLRKIQYAPFQSKDSAPKSAVLIPLCVVDGKTSILYTLRSTNLNTHKGQVSFPGGKQDASDESLEYTAVRETEEELGIDPNHIKVWGSGNLLLARKTAVLPVIGQITIPLDIQNLKYNEHEVEEVFCVSLENLCNKSKNRFTQFKEGYCAPVYLGGPRRIWGITAMITHIFLKSLLPSEVYNHKLKLLHSFKTIPTEPKR